MELIETDHGDLPGQLGRHLLQGPLGVFQLLQLGVGPLHVAVKVNPHFVVHGQALVEHVHQAGFAPADAAPQVGPLHRSPRRPPEPLPAPLQEARFAGGGAGQPLVQRVQAFNRRQLRRVWRQAVLVQVQLVALPGGHCRIIPRP